MKSLITLTLITTVSIFSSMTYAGAGANLYVCINLETTPTKPLTINVMPNTTSASCMYDTGSATSFSASTAGLSCGSIGYIEAKASSTKGDFCATSESKWSVGYSSPGTQYSGATQSEWHTSNTSSNSIDLENFASHTVICTTKALCNGTSVDWNHGTQGPLYIIFQPQATN